MSIGKGSWSLARSVVCVVIGAIGMVFGPCLPPTAPPVALTPAPRPHLAPASLRHTPVLTLGYDIG